MSHPGISLSSFLLVLSLELLPCGLVSCWSSIGSCILLWMLKVLGGSCTSGGIWVSRMGYTVKAFLIVYPSCWQVLLPLLAVFQDSIVDHQLIPASIAVFLSSSLFWCHAGFFSRWLYSLSVMTDVRDLEGGWQTCYYYYYLLLLLLLLLLILLLLLYSTNWI